MRWRPARGGVPRFVATRVRINPRSDEWYYAVIAEEKILAWTELPEFRLGEEEAT